MAADYREEKSATAWTFVVMALALAISIACNVLLLQKVSRHTDVNVVMDTVCIVTYDTVICEMPVARDSVVVRYKTVMLPAVRDTITDTITAAWSDSVLVDIPIEQKVYSDSTYRAYVSGFDVNLDSIYIIRNTQSFITTRQRQTRAKKWHVSASIGYGIGDAGLTPYLGLGLSYSLFGF